MFSRILVPLDGSAQSNVALPLSRTLARQTGAQITLLRVVPQPYLLTEREDFDETREALKRIADGLASSGIAVESVVRAGEIVDEILKQSRTQGADLIVMRTHGRVGLGRAVLGSVTERVLAESKVPVLLLRPGGRRVTDVRTLLVPIDGSPGGAVALGTAVELAKNTGASMKLLEIAEPIPPYLYAGGMYGGMSYVDPAWDEEALASAGTYVEGIARRLRDAHMTVTGEAHQSSDVAHAIVEKADQTQADLIVMSTQALRGPARALLGSVADAVVRTAHCPVLLVHRNESRPAKSATPVGANLVGQPV
jgi:nucleotide-binding universal stress UspA family protein